MKMTQKEWDCRTYKPKYFIGDRVFGRWNKIPFVGSVANDSVISADTGPKVGIFLDLPIKHKNKVYTVIFTEHKHITKLINFDSLPAGKKKKNTIGKSSID